MFAASAWWTTALTCASVRDGSATMRAASSPAAAVAGPFNTAAIFWNAVRAHPVFRGALSGVNAAVVGILLAALYSPVWTSAVLRPADFGLAVAAETPTAEYGAATWPQLREMADAGIEIGDHTWSHPLLPRCSASHLEREIGGSKAILEERLGLAVRSFAYPHGGCNDAVREVVRRAGYENAVIGTNWQSLDWRDDFAIPRLSHGGPLPRFRTTISGFYNLAAQFGYRAVREEMRS